jgi:hypothetical protein
MRKTKRITEAINTTPPSINSSEGTINNPKNARSRSIPP